MENRPCRQTGRQQKQQQKITQEPESYAILYQNKNTLARHFLSSFRETNVTESVSLRLAWYIKSILIDLSPLQMSGNELANLERKSHERRHKIYARHYRDYTGTQSLKWTPGLRAIMLIGRP